MGEWFLRQFNQAFKNFYDECGTDLREAIDECLDRFFEVGNLIRMPYSRHLEDKIFEFRASTHEEEARLLYFYAKDRRRTAVIAVAFKKKTKKTPRNKIDEAKQIRDLVTAKPEKTNVVVN